MVEPMTRWLATRLSDGGLLAHYKLYILSGLAGMAGFEPAADGVKGRCLTAWRHPCIAAPFLRHIGCAFLPTFAGNGGTGRIRTHARLSPPISFQDCSLKPLGYCSVWSHRAGFPGLRGTSRLSEPPLGEEKKMKIRMEPVTGIEPATLCLEGRCSTD